MAFFKTKNDNDELARMNTLGPSSQAQSMGGQAAPQQQGQQAPMGGSQAPASASGSPTQAPAPKSTKGSGMGADLRKYVAANKPQSISQGVEKATQSQAQAVGQQIQKQQSDFMSKVNQQRDMQQRAFQQAQSALQQAQNIGAGQQLDDQAIQQFQQASQMKAQTPELDLTQAKAQAQRLGNIAQQAATGRKSDLLRQAFAGQGQKYTAGQSALDELILSGDRQAGERIVTQAQDAAKQQQQALAEARKQALAQRGELSAGAADIRQQLTSGAEQATEALRGQVEGRLEGINNLKQAFESGQLTQENIDQLGYDRLYGVDPSTYLKQATASSLATAEDLARSQALARLAGREQDIILDPTQVGAEDPTGLKALQDIIGQRKSEYEQGIGDLGFQRAGETLGLDLGGSLGLQQLSSEGAQRFFDRGAGILERAVSEGRVLTGSEVNALRNLGLEDRYKQLTTRDVGSRLSDPRYTAATTRTRQLLEAIKPQLSQYRQLQSKYNPNQVLSPIQAANGAVKQSKAQLLRKLLEK